jgi:hypothetical protein
MIKKWLQQYENLKACKAEHGHCNMHTNRSRLGRWTDIQRQQFRRKELRKDRKELLDKIGFVWEAYYDDIRWQDTFDMLKEFKEIHGHIDVPKKKNFE